MPKMLPLLLLAPPLALLGACAAESESTPKRTPPAAEITGEARNCLQSSTIRSTKVQDDSTIDFTTTRGEVFRNTLPARCPGLAFEDRFGYQTSTGQLCNVDTVTLIYSDGRRGVTCGLGKFAPIRYRDDGG